MIPTAAVEPDAGVGVGGDGLSVTTSPRIEIKS
jgi:hypothetical protein